MVTPEEYNAMMMNQQTIPQPDQNPQVPYFPPVSPINETTLVSQTNPAPLILELQHKLRCEIPKIGDDGRETWERPKGIDPLLNENGIHSIITDVMGVVNQGTILSNITDDDVRKIVIEVGKTVTFKLAMNWKEYDCKKSNLTTIVLTVTNMCFMALKRADQQGERNFIKNVGRYTEHIAVGGQNNMQQQEKKGLSKVFPWNW